MINGTLFFDEVLLPDGQWHRVDLGSFEWNGNRKKQTFAFRENGRVIEGPASSVLAVASRQTPIERTWPSELDIANADGPAS